MHQQRQSPIILFGTKYIRNRRHTHYVYGKSDASWQEHHDEIMNNSSGNINL